MTDLEVLKFILGQNSEVWEDVFESEDNLEVNSEIDDYKLN